MKKQIKALVFDLGGVVMHGGYLDFVHHYVGRHLTGKQKKEIERLEYLVNVGRMSEASFYRHIQKMFKVAATPKQMHDRIIGHMQTNKSLVQYIRSVQKTKVALFSNSIGHISTEMLQARHMGGKKLFDRVFLSNIIHLAKPSKISYLFVVRHLKVKPSQAG